MNRAQRVWLAMEDDTAAVQFLQIARSHVELALEHGKAHTTTERRKAIVDEIKALRDARNAILSDCEGQGGETHAE